MNIDFSEIGVISIISVAISVIYNNFIEHRFNKMIETHKSSLKNSEKLLDYRLKALKELYKIKKNLLSDKTCLEDDYDIALENVVCNFRTHEKSIENFIFDYQAFLSENVFKKLESALYTCSDGKLHAQSYECSDNEMAMAKDLVSSITEAYFYLREDIRNAINPK